MRGNEILQKFISGPLFQTDKRSQKETAISNGETTPKNRHCLRGLNRNYGRWDEILRDILNGKLKIVQNRNKKQEKDAEDDDDDDEEEMSEDTGDRIYDTSERDGRYEPIRTSTEEDVTQIHTDGEIPQGEKIENTIQRSSRNINKPSRYGSVPYTGFLWVAKLEMFVIVQVQTGTQGRKRLNHKPLINQPTSCPER